MIKKLVKEDTNVFKNYSVQFKYSAVGLYDCTILIDNQLSYSGIADEDDKNRINSIIGKCTSDLINIIKK
jgi:hypothetical protein